MFLRHGSEAFLISVMSTLINAHTRQMFRSGKKRYLPTKWGEESILVARVERSRYFCL